MSVFDEHRAHREAGDLTDPLCAVCQAEREVRAHDDPAFTPPSVRRKRQTIRRHRLRSLKGDYEWDPSWGKPMSCELPYPRETITRQEWEQQQHGQSTP